jgi:probable HAF family extracellular repeat protein
VTSRRLVLTFLCTVAVVAGVLSWALYRPALYSVTILPSLGGSHIDAHSLNDAGQVVGVGHMGGEEERLFLWDRRSGMQDLGPVDGDPLCIDNAGRICGTMPDPNGPRAFVWHAGKGRTILDTLGGAHSVALAMNNCGQVVGLSYDANGIPRAFVWDEEGKVIRELKAPDGGRYVPHSINDAGQVLAESIRVPAEVWQWFLIDPNGATLVDGIASSPDLRNVNNRGCVAGVDNSAGLSPRLVLWRKGASPQYIVSVSVHASLTRLNDKGQIAYTNFGDREGTLNEAVSSLWDPVRGSVPLNRYTPGMKRFIVADLNNKGAIVGSAITEEGTTRAVLLEPISGRWRK